MTTALVLIMFAIFFFYVWQLISLFKLNSQLESALDATDLTTALRGGRLATLFEQYEKTLLISTQSGLKTNTPSSLFFTDFNACKSIKVNLRMLDSASGVLVGFGLFGTFLGLTLGIQGFDSSSSENIQSSIQELLEGMATAFITSLVGMALSITYTVFDKAFRIRLTRRLQTISERLDDTFYIDDIALLSLNQEQMMKTLVAELNAELRAEFNDKLTYQTEEGQTTTMANAIRVILKENEEQTKALKSFSTDLAMQLNDGFDEVLSRQMQQRIIPLMESVDTTTRTIIAHIDKMADVVSSPATEMLQTVVNELKKSMSALIDEFKSGLSGSASNELERIAKTIGTASESMINFPIMMETVSSTLEQSIGDIKQAVAEIGTTSATANSEMMSQMQEQISMATGAISTAIEQINEVMLTSTANAQSQSQQVVSDLAAATERMGTFIDGLVGSLTASVQSSVKNLSDDISNRQTDLLALQEDTTERTKKLIDAFNDCVAKLSQINEQIGGTLGQFQAAQGHIAGSTASLKTLTSDMKTASEMFALSQEEYATTMNELQKNGQKGIVEAGEMLKLAGEVSDEYVEKFDVIKAGLGVIFSQIQAGMVEYSKTVQESTRRYLEQYTTSLTQTTNALQSTIQQQNEVVEMLVESLSTHKKK